MIICKTLIKLSLNWNGKNIYKKENPKLQNCTYLIFQLFVEGTEKEKEKDKEFDKLGVPDFLKFLQLFLNVDGQSTL
jgi:DNA modification methylase